jgi:hypothetical protein
VPTVKYFGQGLIKRPAGVHEGWAPADIRETKYCILLYLD